MRKFKGIELPVNSVIVIALAIFVLLMLAAFFGKTAPELDKTQVQSAFNQACSQLSSSYDCKPENVGKVTSGYVVSGKALSFMDICRSYLNDMTADSAKCVKACSTCGSHYAVSGSTCVNEEDCDTPYGELECMTCDVGCTGKICCAKDTDVVKDGHCQTKGGSTPAPTGGCSPTNKGACTALNCVGTGGGTWNYATASCQ